MSSEDNKRVAKNAIALTIRMILVTIVGLYTSRVVLSALGIEDYGIYGVIGGVVGMASFLNAAMSGATSRFITFELGRGNENQLKKIFSTALIIHLIIALVVAVLAETIGLWFVNNKMNFPPDRMFAVNVLYQFTILSMVVGFTQVPYSATIVAHEKMNIYAYFEIINVALKLGVVYLLMIVNGDRLIFYAAMTLCISILSTFIYRFYCIRHFQEARFSFVWDKPALKQMLTFSGFDLYGNMCVTAKSSSIPLIQNIYFGVIVNAGASIAMTVTGTIAGLTTAIGQAFRPQIVKQYSVGDIENMAILMRRSAQFTLLAYAVVALPIFIEAETVLSLWLGQVPQYSVEFVRLIIIAAFFSIVLNTNNAAIHATGNIKNISFYSGTLYLLNPVISYLILRFWIKDVNVIYFMNILFDGIVAILGWLFLKLQIPSIKLRNYVVAISKSWAVIAVVFVVTMILWLKMSIFIFIDGYMSLIMPILFIGFGEAFLLLMMTMFVIDSGDRKAMLSLFRQLLNIFRKS